MKAYQFEGHSDDTFEYHCTDGSYDSQDNCANETPMIYKLTSPSEGSLLVVGQYGLGNVACWTIGVCPVDEGVSIPAWSTAFTLNKAGYSACLWVTVPNDTTIEEVKIS